MDLKTYYFREAKAKTDKNFATYEARRKAREENINSIMKQFRIDFIKLNSLCQCGGVEITTAFCDDSIDDEIYITFSPWDSTKTFELWANTEGFYKIPGNGERSKYDKFMEEEIIFKMGECFYKDLGEHP